MSNEAKTEDEAEAKDSSSNADNNDDEDLFNADDDEDDEQIQQGGEDASTEVNEIADSNGETVGAATPNVDAEESTPSSIIKNDGSEEKNPTHGDKEVPTISSNHENNKDILGKASNSSTKNKESANAKAASGVIPRKTTEASKDYKNNTSNNNNKATPAKPGLNPSLFGLPENVKIPPSIKSNLLQGKLLETLRGLPLQLINDALTEYDDAVQIKGDAIRNQGAYLFGVIKRYVQVQERAAKGEGEGILPMGPDLTPAVNERLSKLVRANFCTEEEMNDKVKSKIRMLSENDALFAIDELASVDRKQIRNFGSYFMGILNRYMRGSAGGGSSKNKDSFHSGGRSDDRRKDDRFRNVRSPDRDFGRGRDKNIRGDPNDHYRRERSRDRFDDRRDGFDRYDRDRYDPRHQNPYGPSRQPMPPPPPPPPPQHQQQQQMMTMMGGMHGNPPPPPPRPAPGHHVGVIPGMEQYHSQHPTGYPRTQNPQLPQQQMYGQTPPINRQHFVPHTGAPPSAFMGQQQQQQQQQQQHVQQQQQQQNPQLYHQQGVVMGGQQQMHQYAPPVVFNNPAAPDGNRPPMRGQQQHHSQQHQSYQMPPHNNNQQQQHQPPHQNQHQPVGRHQQQLVHHSVQGGNPAGHYAPPPTATSGSRWQPAPNNNNQSRSQIPVDILGLADKAASAVQALANQNKLHLPQSGPMGANNNSNNNSSDASNPGGISGSRPMNAPPGPPQIGTSPPYLQHQQHQSPPATNNFPDNNNMNRQGATSAARRRATAKLTELPMSVQYSIQNLQATGQIEGPLDDGMLGMIKDLPEAMALGALQKFSTIDKRTMRNKTAYLAGVLRRELEKINRR